MSIETACNAAVEEIKKYTAQFDKISDAIYLKYVKTKPATIDPTQLKKDIEILKALLADTEKQLTPITAVQRVGDGLSSQRGARIHGTTTLLQTISKMMPK